jgi:hypothetical protein
MGSRAIRIRHGEVSSSGRISGASCEAILDGGALARVPRFPLPQRMIVRTWHPKLAGYAIAFECPLFGGRSEYTRDRLGTGSCPIHASKPVIPNGAYSWITCEI